MCSLKYIIWTILLGILTLSQRAIIGITANGMKEYELTVENNIWNLSHGSFAVRSRLECSNECSKLENVCGFNYIQSTTSQTALSKTCNCIQLTDLVQGGGHLSTDGALLYIRKSCKSVYQSLVASTSPADAMVCMNDSTTYVFKEDMVAIYGSYETLTDGPNSTSSISSMFPETSYPINAAFNDGSYLYLIKENDVWKYSSNRLSYISKPSTTSLFDLGDSDDSGESNIVYDAVLQSGNQTYIFLNDRLDIVESGAVVSSTALDSNNNDNPYKSDRIVDRPQHIVAGCSIDSDRHAFISEGKVYVFTFSASVWEARGYLVWN